MQKKKVEVAPKKPVKKKVKVIPDDEVKSPLLVEEKIVKENLLSIDHIFKMALS